MEKEKIYLGLDIGTNSVGYAVTNNKYDIKKFHGEPAWGSVIFDEGNLQKERRSFRSARRRLARKKQRVLFIQEFFAKEIYKVDPYFYRRIKESALYREDAEEGTSLFYDDNYTDSDYHNEYPSIHHLIDDLMKNKNPHDVRLVYLAISWLVAHRGHFLSNISLENIDQIKDFKSVYDNFMNFFDYEKPWDAEYSTVLADIIKNDMRVNDKYKALKEYLFGTTKPTKEISDTFPYSKEGILKLISGGTYKLKDLYGKEEYDEFGSISLKMDDEKMMEIASQIGDDFELIVALRSISDWSILAKVLGEKKTISKAKVEIYDKHKEDLELLKRIVRKYLPENYNELFRDDNGGKYGAYTKSGKTEDFYKYLKKLLEKINSDGVNDEEVKIVKEKLEFNNFLPKQKNTDNRVIPHQLYLYELIKILDNSEKYLEFLKEEKDGYSVRDKIISVFKFKIPYFVGPLNSNSEHAWIKRKSGAEGKIYPWNFEEIVDLDASEHEFIRRMTNVCTYLPGEDVIPKCSLLYQKFVVLNEINNIAINGERIPVDLKQSIYKDLFMKYNKVSKKKLVDYLKSNGYLDNGDEEALSGIDKNLNGTLSSAKAFKNLMDNEILSEEDVERIILISTYSEEKSRFARWLTNNYPNLSDKDIKYICNIRIKDFGRLSAKFLNGIQGCDKNTGEVFTVIGALWNTKYNLSELILSDDYFTFKSIIEDEQRKYYSENKKKLSDRLDDMYISNAVRRPIFRTLAVLKDVEKAFGKPDKIFVEMARGSDDSQKGKRKDSRLEQILKLYKECKDVDVKILKKQLEDMGEYANNKLQSDKLFLYFMQLGKCMYTGKSINIEEIGTRLYDIDHIYPQAFVTDDSPINNKVLVLSEENGKKSDKYPISEEIRHNMAGFWKLLHNNKLISDEKYKRLTRSTPFTDEEKLGFINRQIVETTQATKAVATFIKEKYPDAEIVYCKSRLASEFRHAFNIYKSRRVNDLHHAVDAYLNIVTGNVYNMRFTKRWFNVNQKYSVKPKVIFTNEVKCGDEIIWNKEMLANVKKQAIKNNAHFVKYSYFKHGGLFDQQPVSKNSGLVPRKKGLDTEKYGGYNKSGIMFFLPVRYRQGKKTNLFVLSVELLCGNRFLEDEKFARDYTFSRLENILGKAVDEVEFPLGMRPWKINTVLSLDGFRVCITGSANVGEKLLLQNIIQLSLSNEWKNYIKKLDNLNTKVKNNNKYIYDKEYDFITEEKNIELYDLLTDKYRNSIYSKRLGNIVSVLIDGKEKFLKLDIFNQCEVLLNIIDTFGREGSDGVNLTMIDGKKRGGAITISTKVINWAKYFKDVRVIDISPSGMWERQSVNLLELL
ncbi:CRISPR-associated endonuclease Csn1 [Acetitomaculum ruminis DSM 5522]|uniref:CRISPR-associated endonuclease Cas9 n=1 Tax=Acetitomaculum ruminis DSM 5522 TaxID=1120918 RepID=A0A1I1AMI4_9FIRM|nr:type II CRISPR RNA-guided endonuclease Cas9 [Acetitomaculum ruminis]SFB39241.1 CRISPR-associated endonuclease Csn1 [Acetitomaculum ruminis DSM 5522]